MRPTRNVLAAVLAASLPVSAATGATITVDTTNDELNTDGDCSLREAVRAANSDTAIDACTAGNGDDTIEVPADVDNGVYTLSVTGSEQGDGSVNDLDLADPNGDRLTVEGVQSAGGVGARPMDVVIEAADGFNNGEARGFQVFSFSRVVNLTIRGFHPGAGANGAAIQMAGDLTLRHAIIRNNESSLDGGGLYQNRGDLVVTDSAFVGNTAGGDGGGWHHHRDVAILQNVTFSRNHADAGGGGVYLNPINSAGTNSYDNLTIVGNTAANDGGGLLAGPDADLELRNSIIAGNRAGGRGPDCNVDSSATGANIGPNTGFNLLGDDTACAPLAINNSVVNTDPRMAPGGRYNGTTPSRPPLSGSPAIDAGSCTSSGGIDISANTDQRRGSNSRNVDGDGDGTPGCDIGAIERQAPPIRVDDLGDTRDQNPGSGGCMDASGNCTLRAAIDEANASSELDEIMLPAGTVTLTRSGTGEDANATGDLDVTEALIIRGQGANASTVDANGLDRVMHHRGASRGPKTLTLQGVTLTGGSVAAEGGAIFSSGQLRLDQSRLTGNETTGATAPVGAAFVVDGQNVDGFRNAGYHLLRSSVDGNSSSGTMVIKTINQRLPNRIVDSVVMNNTTRAADAKIVEWSGELYVESSTIAGNDGIQLDTVLADSLIQVHGSIVAGPTSDNCDGNVTSQGANLESGTDCGFTAAGDRQGVSPDLQPIADVGAGVPLPVPNAASPSVDAGSCLAANGWILPRRPFGGSRPQDAPQSGNTGDGAYECDMGAAERQQVRASAGPNAPSARTVSAGASEVVMAQFELTNESGEALDGRSLTVRAGGSGDDAADITAVRLYLDNNGDGQLDSGDTQVDTARTFDADDGTATFDLTGLSPFLTSGGSVQLLVVYDFNTTLAANAAGPAGAPLNAAGWAAFSLLPLAGTRRRRWLALLPTLILLTACGGGGGGGGGPSQGGSQSETYTVEIERLGVSGASGGNVDVRLERNTGRSVTVEE